MEICTKCRIIGHLKTSAVEVIRSQVGESGEKPGVKVTVIMREPELAKEPKNQEGGLGTLTGS